MPKINEVQTFEPNEATLNFSRFIHLTIEFSLNFEARFWRKKIRKILTKFWFNFHSHGKVAERANELTDYLTSHSSIRA